MRIDPKETINDISMLEIRKLLKRRQNFSWGIHHATRTLHISPEEAKLLLQELEKREIIERSEMGSDDDPYWENTIKGNAIANASAAKPVKRSTAERALSEFLERVAHVNRDPYYLYKVTKVVVFGSYLTDAEKLNDVDLAIEMVRKEENQAEWERMHDQRREEARKQGRNFKSFLDELFWPEQEVRQYLKSRSRILSFHDINEALLEEVETRVVFPV